MLLIYGHSLKNVRRIKTALAEVFPDDPSKGGIALFDLGVNGGALEQRINQRLKCLYLVRKVTPAMCCFVFFYRFGRYANH